MRDVPFLFYMIKYLCAFIGSYLACCGQSELLWGCQHLDCPYLSPCWGWLGVLNWERCLNWKGEQGLGQVWERPQSSGGPGCPRAEGKAPGGARGAAEGSAPNTPQGQTLISGTLPSAQGHPQVTHTLSWGAGCFPRTLSRVSPWKRFQWNTAAPQTWGTVNTQSLWLLTGFSWRKCHTQGR